MATENKQNKRYEPKNNNPGGSGNYNGSGKRLATGEIDELGTHVYLYGSKGQGDQYVRTTEAIGDYVGRIHGKAMRMLVLRGKEMPPVKPTAPTTKPKTRGSTDDADGDPAEWREYDKGLDFYHKKMDKYGEDKAKVFIIIMGQCTSLMRNKIEGSKEYEKLEEDDNVIELLKMIKSFAFSTVSVQYPYWTAAEQFKRVATLRQSPNESLTIYYKRWIAGVQVLETHYGPLIPRVVATDNSDSDEVAMNKYKACLFLLSTDQKKYGMVTDELNNQYLTGTKGYPDNVESMVAILTHRTDHSNEFNKQQRRQTEEHTNGERSSQYWQDNDKGNTKKKDETKDDETHRGGRSIWQLGG